MTEDEAKPYVKPIPYWVPDTRTVIVCWMMVSSFVLVVLCWWRPPPADNQIITMLVSVYVSTGFITAITWWMGSAKGSDANNKMQEKMSEAVAASAGAVVAPAVVVKVSWWSLLAPAEQAGIVAAAPADAQVQTSLTAFQSGKAEATDLATLVSKGLLTQDRSTQIQAA